MSSPEQFLNLTTIGRRSGLPREIEIWFTELDGCYYCIAEYETANWLRNLQANPQVSWRVAGKQFTGSARVVEMHRDRYVWAMVQQLSRDKYGWAEGTIVELRPAA